MRPNRLLAAVLALLGALAILFTASASRPAHSQGSALTSTPDLEATATAIVAQATLDAAAGPSRTPSIGTATPLAGLCNSMTYRELDDVAADIEAALAPLDLVLREVTVAAIEDTEDCVTFNVRETDILIDIATLTIDDETALGDTLADLLAALAPVEALDMLPDVTLTARFAQGNQRRELAFDLLHAFRTLDLETQRGADLLAALTWLD